MLGWRQIVNEFSDKQDIPISLEDVQAAIIKTGAVSRFDILGVDTPHDALWGAYTEYSSSGAYSSPIVGRVRYKKTLSFYWQRLVCCKEMLHSLDKHESFDARGTTQTEDQIGRLIEHFSTDGDRADQLHAALDRFAVIPAIAILFPPTMVKNYRDQFESGDKSISQICDEVELPEEIVNVVLDRRWNPIRFLNLWIYANSEEEDSRS